MQADLIQDIVKQVLADMQLEKSVAVEPANTYGVFDCMDEAIEAAEKGQKQLMQFSLQERDAFVNAIRAAVLKQDVLEMISYDAVEETGIGRVADKLIKNRVAAEKTPGKEDLATLAMTGKDGLTLEELGPFGVIGSITPTTNPTETLINNSISMIVGGNAVVFSPHPRAKRVSATLVKIMNQALEEAGAPANLITMVREPSLDSTNAMMAHPKVRLLVATGGPGIVKTVLSSGKKAIGAGAGNPPVVVDETADIEKAAKDIISGASFDNNVPCIAEKEVFAVEAICDQLVYFMKKNGAYELMDDAKIDELVKAVTKESGKPDPQCVGKSAQFLLQKIGITVDDSVKLIICRVGRHHHLVDEEMMMPILPIVSVPDVDTAIEYAYVAEHGNRHTAIMHSKNVDKLSKMARLLETTIFVKNAPSYAGIGVQGEGHTTFTIAGPTGEGITSAKSFCRRRRCVLSEAFSIR
ncbi:MAG: aldehyde dehydrogenase EutE [Veillonella sp.]|uniref:aldehyde dehydrogenase family protein n=1 Tax=Veillonella sp. TaxID=1926307 RepID=UPI0025E86B33|nr:aldehyde dehydrogenase family protein [Veillonella sp.]MBS4913104.1 aldehyde dehydrogenase EutE [Veillonella sp.]